MGSRNTRYLIKYFKYCKKILDFSIQYILQHVVKISAKSETVELESLLKLVELSWNDPFAKCIDYQHFLIQSDYCTVDGAGIVPYKVTKYQCTKAFKSVVMVG